MTEAGASEWPAAARERWAEAWRATRPPMRPAEIVQQVRGCRDRQDDRFLEAAVNGRADVIITGDRALLVRDLFRGRAGLEPAAYLAR